MVEMHNIAILGGNFSGIGIAHYLLRHVLPSLNAGSGDEPKYKVTIISPSDHTFFKVAAPRALLSEDKVPLDKTFASIPDGFSQYRASEFSFIQGEAVHVDEAAKTVLVKNTKESNEIHIGYGSLVIATGTTSTSPLWSLHGDRQQTMVAMEDIQQRLPQAETVLIAGGGPAGVETAGEIAHDFGSLDITLLSGSTRLLPRIKDVRIGEAAESQLKAVDVKVVHSVRVTSSQQLPDGKTTVRLSDGSIKTVDIYINSTGGVPNTTFLPNKWLDDGKRIAVDPHTLRASKAPHGVYGIGDAASYSNISVPDATGPVSALGYSIWSDLRGSGTDATVLKEKTYNQAQSEVQVVPIGPNGGVGILFGWKIPSFLVWLLKARTFFVEKAPGLIAGSDFLKP